MTFSLPLTHPDARFPGRVGRKAASLDGFGQRNGDGYGSEATPLWTPYFPLLAGIVLEEGSLGQHAAITAREYGVPAIVQLSDATHLIPDGARVAIDGEAGTVTLREP